MNGQILGMVRKDLLRRVRAPLSPLLVLAFPLIFAAIIALTFGGGDNEVPVVRLLLEDRDDGLVGDFVTSAFGRPEAAKYFQVSKVEPGEDGLARLEAEDASALLRLPADLTENLLDAKPVTLELVRNPAQSILPEVAEQVTVLLADALSSAASLLREPLNELRPFIEGDGDQGPSETEVAAISVSVQRILTGAGDYLFPPVVTLETVQLERSGEAQATGAAGSGSLGATLFLLILPGVSIFALFTLGDQGMRDLLTEGRKHTLQRQLSGPVGATTVVVAKALSTATVAALGILLIAPFAAYARYAAGASGFDLAGVLLLSLTVLMAATGFPALIYGLMKSERQGSTLGSLLYLAMAFSGGSLIPLDNLPRALRAISPVSPFYWGTEGYKELLARGGRLADILPHAGILAGLGVVTLALGGFLLRRRVLRGAAG